MTAPRPTPMQLALALAEEAASAGEAPVGAVIVDAAGEVLAAERNCMRALNDPTAHAEMLAIRRALAVRGTGRLDGCDLYVTLEPCALCAGAISFARIRRVVFAADDPKGGAVLHGPRFFEQPTCHHRPRVERAGDAARAGELLRAFFRARR